MIEKIHSLEEGESCDAKLKKEILCLKLKVKDLRESYKESRLQNKKLLKEIFCKINEIAKLREEIKDLQDGKCNIDLNNKLRKRIAELKSRIKSLEEKVKCCENGNHKISHENSESKTRFENTEARQFRVINVGFFFQSSQ